MDYVNGKFLPSYTKGYIHHTAQLCDGPDRGWWHSCEVSIRELRQESYRLRTYCPFLTNYINKSIKMFNIFLRKVTENKATYLVNF